MYKLCFLIFDSASLIKIKPAPSCLHNFSFITLDKNLQPLVLNSTYFILGINILSLILVLGQFRAICKAVHQNMHRADDLIQF